MTAHRLNPEPAAPEFAAGSSAAVSVSANSYKDLSISFGKTFASAPAVAANFATGSTAGKFGLCTLAVNSVSATGMTVRVFNGDTAARSPSVRWIAVGYV